MIATHASSEAPAALLDRVRAYVEHAGSEADAATVIEGSAMSAQVQLTDTAYAEDKTYRLVPLNTRRGEAAKVIAVAAVADQAEHRSVVATARVLDAIATKLEAAYETTHGKRAVSSGALE